MFPSLFRLFRLEPASQHLPPHTHTQALRGDPTSAGKGAGKGAVRKAGAAHPGQAGDEQHPAGGGGSGGVSAWEAGGGRVSRSPRGAPAEKQEEDERWCWAPGCGEGTLRRGVCRAAERVQSGRQQGRVQPNREGPDSCQAADPSVGPGIPLDSYFPYCCVTLNPGTGSQPAPRHLET